MSEKGVDKAVIDGQRTTDFVNRTRSSDNLALLYQGLLTGIVRLQARRQHVTDAATFRRRTKTALQEVEREAMAAGYEGQDIKDAHFAVVAFLDSVILNSKEPIRAEWERKTLQEELFNQTDAGVVFFEKLEHLRTRRDSHHLADVLEVYLLCLLLGFEGRYSGAFRGELDVIAEKTRRRIEDIRGRTRDISPTASLTPGPPAAPETQNKRVPSLALVTLTAVAVTILVYVILKAQLLWTVDQVRSKLL